MVCPQDADQGKVSSVKGSYEYIEKNSRRQPTHGGPQARGLGEVLTTPHCKILSCNEMFTQKASDLY